MRNDILTIKEAAKTLGYTPRYLQKKLWLLRRKRGITIGQKLGSSWTFVHADIEQIRQSTLPVGHPKGGSAFSSH